MATSSSATSASLSASCTASCELTRVLGYNCLTVTVTQVPLSSTCTSVSLSPRGTLTICLDTSRSMKTTSLATAKEALLNNLKLVLETYEIINIVTFNSETQLYVLSHPLSDTALSDVTEYVSALETGHGTCFKTLFARVKALTETPSHRHHNIIFFTDGEDYAHLPTPARRNVAVTDLRAHLAQHTASTRIHTIGFRKHHDAQLLTLLASSGTIPGTFIYAVRNNHLHIALTDALRSAATPVTPATIQPLSPSHAPVRRAHVVSLERLDDARHRAWLLLPSGEGDAPVRVAIRTEECIMEASVLPCDRNDMYERFESGQMGLQLSSEDIEAYASVVRCVVHARVVRDVTLLAEMRVDRQGLLALRAEYSRLEGVLTTMEMGVEGVLTAGVDVKIAHCLVDQFYTHVLADAIRDGAFQNARFAELASVAFRDVRARRFQSTLGKRVARNVEVLDRLEDQVKEVVDAIDFDDKMFDDVDEYGNCIISFMDYKQAMQAGDCLCLGLEMQRPEEAIVNPAHIMVKSVGSSVITADSFLSAVQFGLREDSDGSASPTSPTDVHGGFRLGFSGTVITGNGGEIINGALPLFINECHWRVAKLRMQPLFGWMSTLDILGFSNEQVETIPFIALAQLKIRNDTSEFGTKIYRWLLQTCVRIFEDSHSIRDQLFLKVDEDETDDHVSIKYFSSPDVRLTDQVPSPDLLCAQLLVAEHITIHPYHMSPEEKQRFWTYIVIEDTRRWLRKANKYIRHHHRDDELHIAVGYRSVDFQPFAESIATELERGSFEDIMKDWELPTWDLSFWKEVRGEPYGWLEAILEDWAGFLNVEKCFSDLQVSAIFVLHNKYPKSKDIRGSEEYRTDLQLLLTDPEKLIESCFNRLVLEHLRAYYDDCMVRFSALLPDMEAVRRFMLEPDLRAAAEMLCGHLYVGRTLGYYINALCNLPWAGHMTVGKIVSHPFEKIQMLVTGKHVDLHLYSDKDDGARRKKFNGHAWKPAKRHLHKMFQRFVLDIDHPQPANMGTRENRLARWKELFPERSEKLDGWFSNDTHCSFKLCIDK